MPAFRNLTLTDANKSLAVARTEEGSVVKAHMMQLDKREREEIYKRFRNDFLLFEYEPDQY